MKLEILNKNMNYTDRYIYHKVILKMNSRLKSKSELLVALHNMNCNRFISA